jgi:hypothetical protein
VVEALQKTVKNEFQSEAARAGMKTVEELNSAFWAWAEMEHNTRIHSSTGQETGFLVAADDAAEIARYSNISRLACSAASSSGQRLMLLEPLRERYCAPEICCIRTSPVETTEEFQEFVVIEAEAPELTDNLVAFRTEFFSKRRVVPAGIVRKHLRGREARGDAAGREEKGLRVWGRRQFVCECEESGMVLPMENARSESYEREIAESRNTSLLGAH